MTASPGRSLILSFILILAACISPSFAADAPPASAPAIDAKSKEVFDRVGAFHKAAKKASAKVATTMSFSGGGQSQNSNYTTEIAVERPNKLAVKVTDERTGGGNVVSDGQKLNLHLTQMKKYSEQAAPATLDELLDGPAIALAQQSGVVAMLFHSDPIPKLIENVAKATYVGQDDIDGVKFDHLRLEQPDIDLDVWFAAGEKPTLRRIKPDMSRNLKQMALQNPQLADAKADMSIDVTDWKLDDASAAQFAFAAPQGVEKVDSIEELFAGDQPAMKLKGQAAADFTLDLLGGGQAKLADHKGKNVVILDFWATWCGPCVRTMPIIHEVAQAYADKGVVLYAVNQQEDAATIEPFLKDNKLTGIKVPLDKDGAVAGKYAVQGIPQTVIIGKDGIVKKVHIGFSQNLKQQLTKDLDKILAESK